MTRKRLGAVAAAVVVAAGGTGTAIAVTKKDEARQAEDAVIAGAAERLDVTPERLRDALAAAQDDQLDAQVKAGRITQEQADAIKARRKATGRVLGGPGAKLRGGGHGHGFGRRGFHHRGGKVRGIAFEELAKALGVTQAKLGDAFRDGKTVGEIARAEGKDIADVQAALKAAAKRHVDEAVADDELTKAQGDRLLTRLNRMIERVAQFPRMGPGRRGFRGPGGPGGGPPPSPPGP